MKSNELNVEQDEHIKEDDVESTGRKVKFSNKKVIQTIVYSLICIGSIIYRYTVPSINVVLGDFGSIIPILLNIVSLMGLKYICVFCVVGICITWIDKFFKGFNDLFFKLVIFITVISVGLQLALLLF